MLTIFKRSIHWKFHISQSSISHIIQKFDHIIPFLHDHLNKLNKQAQASLTLQFSTNKSHVTRLLPPVRSSSVSSSSSRGGRCCIALPGSRIESPPCLIYERWKGRIDDNRCTSVEKKLPGTAQMHSEGERTCHGQWANRVQKGLLDTSGSHFFDNRRKKALHVYLWGKTIAVARLERWLSR